MEGLHCIHHDDISSTVAMLSQYRGGLGIPPENSTLTLINWNSMASSPSSIIVVVVDYIIIEATISDFLFSTLLSVLGMAPQLLSVCEWWFLFTQQLCGNFRLIILEVAMEYNSFCSNHSSRMYLPCNWISLLSGGILVCKPDGFVYAVKSPSTVRI